jgi:hypothetical protein
MYMMPFSEGCRIITISRDSCGEMAGAAAEKASSKAAWPSVRPATRGMCVVTRAAARLTAGRIVVSRRASLDVPPRRAPTSARYGHHSCLALTFTSTSRRGG